MRRDETRSCVLVFLLLSDSVHRATEHTRSETHKFRYQRALFPPYLIPLSFSLTLTLSCSFRYGVILREQLLPTYWFFLKRQKAEMRDWEKCKVVVCTRERERSIGYVHVHRCRHLTGSASTALLHCDRSDGSEHTLGLYVLYYTQIYPHSTFFLPFLYLLLRVLIHKDPSSLPISSPTLRHWVPLWLANPLLTAHLCGFLLSFLFPAPLPTIHLLPDPSLWLSCGFVT